MKKIFIIGLVLIFVSGCGTTLEEDFGESPEQNVLLQAPKETTGTASPEENDPAGATTTALPVISKISITQGASTSLVGANDSVVNNAEVKIYNDSHRVLGTTTANSNGAFSISIASTTSFYITAEITGKSESNPVYFSTF